MFRKLCVSVCSSQLSPLSQEHHWLPPSPGLALKYTSWTIIKCLTQTEELWGLEMETDLALRSQDNSALKRNMFGQIEREPEKGEVNRNYRSSHNILQQTSISKLRTFSLAPHGHFDSKTFMFSAQQKGGRQWNGKRQRWHWLKLIFMLVCWSLILCLYIA